MWQLTIAPGIISLYICHLFSLYKSLGKVTHFSSKFIFTVLTFITLKNAWNSLSRHGHVSTRNYKVFTTRSPVPRIQQTRSIRSIQHWRNRYCLKHKQTPRRVTMTNFEGSIFFKELAVALGVARESLNIK